MRILFVDDDSTVLAGIERALFACAPEDWECDLANSGHEALERYGEEDYDVIVADLNMPRMTGLELFHELIHGRRPAVRVMLSGASDLNSLAQALSSAHLVLTKPTQGPELVTALRRAERVAALSIESELKALAATCRLLPSPPDFYRTLGEDDARPRERVAGDPGALAKALHIAMSGGARGSAERGSVQALLDSVDTRLLHETGRAAEAATGAVRVDAQSVQDNTTTSRLVSKIAREIVRDPGLQDVAECAGMLHSCGRLLRLGGAAEGRRAEATASPAGALGACLLSYWGVPGDVVEAVAQHEQPGAGASRVAWALHLAEGAVRQARQGGDFESELGTAPAYCREWHAQACLLADEVVRRL